VRVLELSNFPELFEVLIADGYRVMGPTVQGGAIVYDDLASAAALPIGWTDRQDAGAYKLERRDDDALFGYVVGPQSWKRIFHPPAATVWSGLRSEDGFETSPPGTPDRYALIGVRACELAAIAVQDGVFLGGDFVDGVYRDRRSGSFLVAVNCTEPGGTCFCTSMGTGPGVTQGFDLVLTEVIDGSGHYFVVEAGSDAGAGVLDRLPTRAAEEAEVEGASSLVDDAAGRMGRTLDPTDIVDLLLGNPSHPRWEQVAQRCLSCANCTMACPTCFCASVEDEIDLDGSAARRVRRWDSCFNDEFSYLHGGSLRTSTSARYRQWMTHKLASWVVQYGTSGCVGCGRCITWCPVGIDITEEVAAMRESEAARVTS
jgi:ferredoxin